MTMITPSYLGETIEYSSLHACRSTLEDPISSSNGAVRRDDHDLRSLAATPRSASRAAILGVFRGGSARMAGTLIGRVAMFGLVVAVARLSQPSQAGAYFVGAAVAAVLSLVFGFGGPEAIGRIGGAARGLHGSATGLGHLALRRAAISTGAAGSVAVVLAAGLQLTGVDRGSFFIPAIGIGGAVAAQNSLAAALRVQERVVRAEAATAAVPVVLLISFLALSRVTRLSGVGLLWLRLCLEVSALVVLGLHLWSKRQEHVRGISEEVRRSARPLWLTGLSWLAIQNGDVLSLAALFGTAAVGRYTPVLKLVEVSALASSALGPYVLPAASRLGRTRDASVVAQLYRAASLAAFLFAAPLLAVMIVEPGPCLRLMVGSASAGGVAAARILGVAYLVNACLGLNGVVLEATAELPTIARRALVALAVAAIADGAFVAAFGTVGAALGTLTALVSLNLINSGLLYRRARILPMSGGFGAAATAVLLVALAVGGASIGLTPGVRATLVAGVTAAAVAVATLVALSAQWQYPWRSSMVG